MTIKNFVTFGLTAGDVLVIVRLDVKCAFGAAWWAAILKGLRAYECSNILFNMAWCYFTQRSAYVTKNN